MKFEKGQEIEWMKSGDNVGREGIVELFKEDSLTLVFRDKEGTEWAVPSFECRLLNQEGIHEKN